MSNNLCRMLSRRVSSRTAISRHRQSKPFRYSLSYKIIMFRVQVNSGLRISWLSEAAICPT